MTSETESDFFATYKAVSNKLKKKFLKKPSIADMSSDFGKLARNLDDKSCSQYAGLCCVAMAKCEQSMSNTFNEVEALIRASRYFLNSDSYLEAIKCPNFREHLRSAIECYDQAIKIYTTQGLSHLAGSLCMEVADFLCKSKLKSEALLRYQQAVQLFDLYPSFCVSALKKIAEVRIDLNNFLGALDACTLALKIIEEKGGYQNDGKTLVDSFFDVHKDMELMAVFLLMFLNMSPLKISAEHSLLLQKYTWDGLGGSSNVSNRIDPKLFILIQSFVMACSSHNIKSMLFLQNKLEPYLSPSLYLLVDTVVDEYKNPKFIA